MRALVENRPGFAPERLAHLMEEAIDACRLNLSGAIVLTEGATLAYAVTPVIAAMAGAESVIAIAQPTPYGSVIDITAQTMALASRAGVGPRIRITRGKREADVRVADIVTNSGNVRPIDARMISWLKPTAVVSLMFEAWEIQAGRFDVDLAALRRRGIAVAGTNERHPAIGVFNYLPTMAIRLLNDAGMGVYGTSIVLLCDNPFADYLLSGLERAGANVRCVARVDDLEGAEPDVLLVAMRPTGAPVIDTAAAARIAKLWPKTAVVQFWGDIDRSALNVVGMRCWPIEGPRPGHMAILPSDLGPDPVVRLQTGGLKVGEVLLKPQHLRTEADKEFLDEL